MSETVIIALIAAAGVVLNWLSTRRTADQIERAAERAHWAAERADLIAARAEERVERLRVEAVNDRLRDALDLRERALRRAGLPLPDDTPSKGTPAVAPGKGDAS